MLLWIGIGVVYLLLLVSLGLMSLRKGHWVMFIIGIFLPVFWVIGALIGPTAAAARPSAVGSGSVG
jgi:hypothetical protein